ncbi:MAG: hypothetical protein LBD41_02880 [Clostridiales Family XIII bacterium]|jgi:hypothetical protein|nr:hypothetical protein [Clostridiales Family XIII bacterium]
MTIFTPKNILTAYCFARRSRRKKQEVYIFDRNLELNLLNMLKDLKERKYKHNDYKQIVLYDTKKRYIYSPYFQDHILHHMTYMQIYNILDNKMTHSTFACRK